MDLLLDVYAPEATPLQPRPAFVIMHGGSWMGGSRKKLELQASAMFYASRGFVCFSIDYREQDDYGTYPTNWPDLVPVAPKKDHDKLPASEYTATRDLKAAIRFVRANAARFGVDTERVALIGGASSPPHYSRPVGCSPRLPPHLLRCPLQPSSPPTPPPLYHHLTTHPLSLLPTGSAGAISTVTAGVVDEADYKDELLTTDPTLPSTNLNQTSAVQAVVSHWGAGYGVDAVQDADPSHRSRYARITIESHRPLKPRLPSSSTTLVVRLRLLALSLAGTATARVRSSSSTGTRTRPCRMRTH